MEFDLLRRHIYYHGLLRFGLQNGGVGFMINRRRALTLTVATALVLSVGLSAQEKDGKKQSDAQKKEIQNAVKIVDDVVAGKPAPNDFGLTWVREDFLKAQDNMAYVPFTVAINPPTSNGNLAFYWRVVKVDGAAEAVAPEKEDEKDEDQAMGQLAYEDASFVPVKAGTSPTRITRSFTVPAGTYDVYAIVQESFEKKKNPAPKVSVLKQTVTVPQFWNSELNTSSVIVTSRIDPLPAPLTTEQQIERPYALGGMELQPVWDLKLPKTTELSTFMMIYNPQVDATNKPNVAVDYSFYSKSGSGEKFFNKTSPQMLNAETLPPQFDIAAGHQLEAAQAVPLASFPDGDYRLEIKVTDKHSNQSLTRDVNFTVTAS